MAELTQRFSGRSLEEAIGNATDALGSGAEVIEAKRVRRGGILGVMKHDSYEVTARPRTRQARAQQQPASFDHQLASMIDEVDLREERQVFNPAQARPARAQEPQRRARSGAAEGRPRVANRFSDDDLVPLGPEPVRAAAPPRATAQTRAATAPRVAAARQGAPARSASAPAASAPARSAAGARTAAPRRESVSERQLSHALASSTMVGSGGDALPPPPGQEGRASTIDLREERGSGPVWSTERLRELGVPDVVLELMPTASLDSDVAWTVALEAAIRARLPLTPTVPLAVHGYGDNAAVKMLESTLNGYAVGDLHLIDRIVPATSFELTLAIRACLSR